MNVDEILAELRQPVYAYPAHAREGTRMDAPIGGVVKRAAFVLIAVRAVHDKRTDGGAFADLIPTVMAAADDDRPYVRKGASWALRQIGKRSHRVRARVLDTVTPCIHSDSHGVRWVARDISRELLEPGSRRLRAR